MSDDYKKGLVPRKTRRQKHELFIERCLRMEPGEWFDVEVPRAQGVLRARRMYRRVIERHVRELLPEYLHSVFCTEDRKLRVVCRVRPKSGKLAFHKRRRGDVGSV